MRHIHDTAFLDIFISFDRFGCKALEVDASWAVNLCVHTLLQDHLIGIGPQWSS
jgi:hypothetical protein